MEQNADFRLKFLDSPAFAEAGIRAPADGEEDSVVLRKWTAWLEMSIVPAESPE